MLLFPRYSQRTTRSNQSRPVQIPFIIRGRRHPKRWNGCTAAKLCIVVPGDAAEDKSIRSVRKTLHGCFGAPQRNAELNSFRSTFQRGFCKSALGGECRRSSLPRVATVRCSTDRQVQSSLKEAYVRHFCSSNKHSTWMPSNTLSIS